MDNSGTGTINIENGCVWPNRNTEYGIPRQSWQYFQQTSSPGCTDTTSNRQICKQLDSDRHKHTYTHTQTQENKPLLTNSPT